MKKTFVSLALIFGMLSSANAEYRIIQTDKPGGGGSVWTSTVLRQLNKFMDEPIVMEHIPGARNIPGANKFQKEYRFDNKYLLTTVGSNSTNLLMEKTDYNFADWDAIGGQNLDMIVGRSVKFDGSQKLVWGNTAGLVDSTGMALMICGNLENMDAYLKCWNEKAKYVSGVSSADQKLSFLRGEFNVTRDSPAAWNKNYSKNTDVTIWYSNGIWDSKNAKQIPNPNFNDKHFFVNVFKDKWGVEPKGEMYDVYSLLIPANNAMQKVIWVNKGNPNTKKIREAFKRMLADKESMAQLDKDLGGSYGWFVGDEMNKVYNQVFSNVTEVQLKNITKWYTNALKADSLYKPEMITKK